MANLRNQFEQALTNIEVNGQKRKRAIDAHTEIRELLQQDEQLKEWGVEPILIGSYGRDTGIYPGKDVDVFLRFTSLDTRAEPRAVYDAVWRVIVRKYGQLGQGGGRAQQQARSVKVQFPDLDRISGEDFSVDAVPAVRNGDLWAIPTKDQNRWVDGEGRWSPPAPYNSGPFHGAESIGLRSEVGDRPAYKPIVKLVRQIRETHLGDKRPGGLYLEFVTFEAWRSGLVGGANGMCSWLGRSRALRIVLARRESILYGTLSSAPPSIHRCRQDRSSRLRPYSRSWRAAADRALPMNDTDAATEWRKILGGNDRYKSVLPYPPNTGGRVGSTVTTAGVGVANGTGATTRRNEATGFG